MAQFFRASLSALCHELRAGGEAASGLQIGIEEAREIPTLFHRGVPFVLEAISLGEEAGLISSQGISL